MPFGLQAKDIISPAISFLGALLSWLFLRRNYSLSRMNADRSIYVDGQKFLMEICKQLISEPLLWTVYDERVFEGEDGEQVKTPKFQAKLRAFAHLHLNMFEIVLQEAPNPKEGDSENLSNMWTNYFEDTLNRSTLIRNVLEEPATRTIWSRVILQKYRQWKETRPAARAS
jgi:hypothetical protein